MKLEEVFIECERLGIELSVADGILIVDECPEEMNKDLDRSIFDHRNEIKKRIRLRPAAPDLEVTSK